MEPGAADHRVAEYQAGVEASPLRALCGYGRIDLGAGEFLSCCDRVDHGPQVGELLEHLGASTVDERIEQLVSLFDELQAEEAVELVIEGGTGVERAAVRCR